MTPRTPKLKIFTGSNLFVPRPWLDAMGGPRHRQQVCVLAIAASKADLAVLAGDDRMAAEMRLARSLSTPDAALIDAGVVDIAARGVYAYRDFVKDRTVIRVEPDGSCSVAGHFRRSGGRMTVEREADQ